VLSGSRLSLSYGLSFHSESGRGLFLALNGRVFQLREHRGLPSSDRLRLGNSPQN